MVRDERPLKVLCQLLPDPPFFFKKKGRNRKIEISQRSGRVGTPDLDSLQIKSFPIDFSRKNIFSATGVGVGWGELVTEYSCI